MGQWKRGKLDMMLCLHSAKGEAGDTVCALNLFNESQQGPKLDVTRAGRTDVGNETRRIGQILFFAIVTSQN